LGSELADRGGDRGARTWMIVSVCLFAFFSFLFFSFLFFGEILGYYFKEFQDQGRENSLAPVGAFPLGRLIGFGDHHPSKKKKK